MLPIQEVFVLLVVTRMTCVNHKLALFVSTGTDDAWKTESTFSPVRELGGHSIVLIQYFSEGKVNLPLL